MSICKATYTMDVGDPASEMEHWETFGCTLQTHNGPHEDEDAGILWAWAVSDAVEETK